MRIPHAAAATWVRIGGMLALGIAALALLAGCTAQASELRDVPTDDELLERAETDDSGAWASAPMVRARWIPYHGRSSVRVAHGLGRLPTTVEAYLSADEDDSKVDNPRNSFVGSGNIVTITDVDAEAVTLKNNTPGDFFVRLVVR